MKSINEYLKKKTDGTISDTEKAGENTVGVDEESASLFNEKTWVGVVECEESEKIGRAFIALVSETGHHVPNMTQSKVFDENVLKAW